MKRGKTTLIEAMINQELGEPFRRDAMKKPVSVAGIDPSDMRPHRPLLAIGGVAGRQAVRLGTAPENFRRIAISLLAFLALLGLMKSVM
jgi:hypothetical protein